MKCFYHSADLDGHCSGAIVKFVFQECEMIGIDYGRPFPWGKLQDQSETVFMVDFSLQPFEDMIRLVNSCRLTWIDHHKTAIDEYQALVKSGISFGVDPYLSTNFAACELCWKYLAAHVAAALSTFEERMAAARMPECVRLLGRYDIWKHHETPGALEFQYGMRAFADTRPESPIWADLLAGKHTDRVINDGITLLQYEKSQNEKFIQSYGFDVEFEGLKCIAANRGMSNSLLFESVWNHEKYDAMLLFAWKNGQFTVSLYTDKPDVDVSAIAKAHGGGGHKGAAGFQCSSLPFLRHGP